MLVCELSNFISGWIRADGDQIGKQIVTSVKAAIAAKEK